MASMTTPSRPRVWRRLAIGVLGVAALLICLLAMNHGTGDNMSGSGKVAAAQTAQSTEQVMTPALDRGVTPLSGEQCGGACAPAHEVVAVACMLVLLVTVVLLAADLILTRRIFLRQILVTLVAKAATLAPPAPPSLYVLSISRT